MWYPLWRQVILTPFFRISPWPPQIAMKEALVLLERRDILEELAPKEKVYENNWIHNEL